MFTHIIAFVIGGLFVASGMYALLAQRQKEWDEEGANLKNELDDQRSANVALKNEVEEREGVIRSEHEALEGKLQEARKQGEATGIEIQSGETQEVQSQMEELQQEFEEYRETFRVSLNQQWEGREWEQLVLADGSELSKVRFRSVDADGMRVIHAKGARFITNQEMPQDLLVECGFHEEDEQSKKEERAAMAVAQAQRLRDRQVRNQASAEQHRLQQAEVELQEMRAELTLLDRQIREMRERRNQLASEARSIRNHQSQRERSNYVPAYRLDQQASELDGLINQKLERVQFLQARVNR